MYHAHCCLVLDFRWRLPELRCHCTSQAPVPTVWAYAGNSLLLALAQHYCDQLLPVDIESMQGISLSFPTRWLAWTSHIFCGKFSLEFQALVNARAQRIPAVPATTFHPHPWTTCHTRTHDRGTYHSTDIHHAPHMAFLSHDTHITDTRRLYSNTHYRLQNQWYPPPWWNMGCLHPTNEGLLSCALASANHPQCKWLAAFP